MSLLTILEYFGYCFLGGVAIGSIAAMINTIDNKFDIEEDKE